VSGPLLKTETLSKVNFNSKKGIGAASGFAGESRKGVTRKDHVNDVSKWKIRTRRKVREFHGGMQRDTLFSRSADQ